MKTLRRFRRRLAGALIAVAVISPALVGTATADAPTGAPDGHITIQPGFDLFQTDPGTSFFDGSFPPNPFGPGCQTFPDRIDLAGVPLGTFDFGSGPVNVGDTDTIVERQGSATPNPTATIPIEIVSLNLVGQEPVLIDCPDGIQQWDVRVTLSPNTPSTGQMTINELGTFDSVLQVHPMFEFHRIPDGAHVEIDGPSVEFPPLEFFAEGVPYVPTNCPQPLLHVPGVNDGFCPSFDGGKVLTQELAAFAAHGVYPAQPALEHFKCYRVGNKPFDARSVTLIDQFQETNQVVTDRVRLCNPARKNSEQFKNKRSHLVCYETTGPNVGVGVVVRNQFGSQQLVVEDPEWLCVPSQKRLPGSDHRFRATNFTDHFQCYNVFDPNFEAGGILRVGPLEPVELKDQFIKETLEVGPAKLLCAPVSKNHEGIEHPVDHLVCYQIKGKKVSQPVVIRNQFEHKIKVKALRSFELCVPSTKLHWDHLAIPPEFPA